MPKKKWEKPKPVVLVRGRPEDRVLDVCKTGTGGEGELHHLADCFNGFFPCVSVLETSLS